MRAALTFLTILGGATPPEPRAGRWFAPVGVMLGAVLGGIWWVAGELWPPLVAALLVVTFDAALTGMLHLDGTADSGDGLLAPLERERRLAAMSDPAIGAFGVVAVVLVVSLRIGTLAVLAPNPLLLAGLWGASRGLMATVMTSLPYARSEGGLASGFRSARTKAGTTAAAAGTAGALVLTGVAGGVPAGIAAAAGMLAGSLAVVALAWRRLGGFTGDTLGATGTVGETFGLLLAAARW